MSFDFFLSIITSVKDEHTAVRAPAGRTVTARCRLLLSVVRPGHTFQVLAQKHRHD
jgi:hypothetical protein